MSSSLIEWSSASPLACPFSFVTWLLEEVSAELGTRGRSSSESMAESLDIVRINLPRRKEPRKVLQYQRLVVWERGRTKLAELSGSVLIFFWPSVALPALNKSRHLPVVSSTSALS